VLVEAVAAGKPVVATAFPHAAELLASGAGLLVPQFDGAAIADALRRVLTEPGLARRMAAEAALSDDTGHFEHARGAIPLREHGYCVDDVARGLLVICREPRPSAELAALSDRYLAFLTHAQADDGTFHNRLSYQRVWLDPPGTGNWWGRALGHCINDGAIGFAQVALTTLLDRMTKTST
jgi:Glycosyl transferases group 1